MVTYIRHYLTLCYKFINARFTWLSERVNMAMHLPHSESWIFLTIVTCIFALVFIFLNKYNLQIPPDGFAKFFMFSNIVHDYQTRQQGRFHRRWEWFEVLRNSGVKMYNYFKNMASTVRVLRLIMNMKHKGLFSRCFSLTVQFYADSSHPFVDIFLFLLSCTVSFDAKCV